VLLIIIYIFFVCFTPNVIIRHKLKPAFWHGLVLAPESINQLINFYFSTNVAFGLALQRKENMENEGKRSWTN
jgi:hypothetical protein